MTIDVKVTDFVLTKSCMNPSIAKTAQNARGDPSVMLIAAAARTRVAAA
jgi:hypothetical protein